MLRPTIQLDPSRTNALTTSVQDRSQGFTTWNVIVKAFIVMDLLWMPRNRVSARPLLELRIASSSAIRLAISFDPGLPHQPLKPKSWPHYRTTHSSSSTQTTICSPFDQFPVMVAEDVLRLLSHVFCRYYGNCRYHRLLPRLPTSTEFPQSLSALPVFHRANIISNIRESSDMCVLPRSLLACQTSSAVSPYTGAVTHMSGIKRRKIGTPN